MADSKKRGYGVDNGNYGLGLTVVSAPILDALGRISHAVVVFGIREQVEQIGIEKIAEELKAIAAPFSSGSPLLAD